jgi:hypothetical protein
MFNLWIAQGLGKISATLVWALGHKHTEIITIRTEVIDLTSSILPRQENFVSHICRYLPFVSLMKDLLNLKSGTCRTLEFTSHIKTEEYSE